MGSSSVIVLLWALKRKHALFLTVILANAAFTLALMVHTIALLAVLFGFASEALHGLILDVTLMSVANILIFSIWYWVVDPPGVEISPAPMSRGIFFFHNEEPVCPTMNSWVPRYADYLFIAFTTSFAFTPTDTPPLTRRAKMLMLLQGAISVVTLTGIAAEVRSISLPASDNAEIQYLFAVPRPSSYCNNCRSNFTVASRTMGGSHAGPGAESPFQPIFHASFSEDKPLPDPTGFKPNIRVTIRRQADRKSAEKSRRRDFHTFTHR